MSTMTSRGAPRSRSRRSRTLGTALATAAATVLLLVGIPAATTGAYLTSKVNVSTTAPTIGEWCAVPSSTTHANVYPLKDFPTVTVPASGGGTTPMRVLELPVVRDASFAPVQAVAGSRGQLGIRLWSCSDTSRLSGQVKATSWRGDYDGGQSFNWTAAPTLGSFASARLNPASNGIVNANTSSSTNPGAELRDLHRGLNGLGGRGFLQADKVTMRYSWLLESFRSSGNPASDPYCGSQLCELRPGDGAALSTAFSNASTSVPTTGTPGRVATYGAEKYWSAGGRWGCFLSVCAPSGSILDPAAGNTVDDLVRDTSGTALQWVVLEWRATAEVPADLAVEVYVIP
jgi:hypothetical protein